MPVTNPFRVLQDRNFQDSGGNTEPQNFNRKEFSFFVFIDNLSVGKLSILKSIGYQPEFVEIIDLDMSALAEMGSSLWNLCSNKPGVKSALIVRGKFTAGNSKFDELLIALPRASEVAKLALYLKQAKFR